MNIHFETSWSFLRDLTYYNGWYVRETKITPSLTKIDTEMNPGELKNIYYINFVPEDPRRDTGSHSKFEAFKEDIELNFQFINSKANSAIEDKIVSGNLKNEAVAKAAYKARVVSHLVSATPWYVSLIVWARNLTHCMQDGDYLCYE